MRNLDSCDQCTNGIMRIYTTRTRGFLRTRYLKCDRCSETGKEIVRLDSKNREVSTSDSINNIVCPNCCCTMTAPIQMIVAQANTQTI
jgi:hypothetical protein